MACAARCCEWPPSKHRASPRRRAPAWAASPAYNPSRMTLRAPVRHSNNALSPILLVSHARGDLLLVIVIGSFVIVYIEVKRSLLVIVTCGALLLARHCLAAIALSLSLSLSLSLAMADQAPPSESTPSSYSSLGSYANFDAFALSTRQTTVASIEHAVRCAGLARARPRSSDRVPPPPAPSRCR